MNPVTLALAREKALAIAAAENRLATETAAALGYTGERVTDGWQHFANWCATYGVRHLPAAPSTVAAYVLAMYAIGIKFQAIIGGLEAIAALHGETGNPVATGIVGAALDRIADEAIQAPRSWKGAEKAEFYLLPVWTQAVLSRREHEREKAIRNAQNELAKARRNDAEASKDVRNAA